MVLNRTKEHALEKYGEGFVSDILNDGKSFVNKIINGRSGYSPSVQKHLNKIGDEIITSIEIGRNPVQSAITNSLKLFSNVPYDKLFHLFVIITTSLGKKLKIEKTAQITLTINATMVNDTEFFSVSCPSNLTVNELLDKTKIYMGDKFYRYSASSNNCQDFILAMLKSNNINQGIDFVKQDTESIFSSNPNLRKFANTITDIGNRTDVIMQGGNIKYKKSYTQFNK